MAAAATAGFIMCVSGPLNAVPYCRTQLACLAVQFELSWVPAGSASDTHTPGDALLLYIAIRNTLLRCAHLQFDTSSKPQQHAEISCQCCCAQPCYKATSQCAPSKCLRAAVTCRSLTSAAVSSFRSCGRMRDPQSPANAAQQCQGEMNAAAVAAAAR